MYFLIASGLSLIYGLMGVLNFAHGAFLTVGAYALWFTESKLGAVSVSARFLIAALVGLAVATVFAALVELLLIRPLYGRHIEQVLVTVGLALASTALVTAIWGNDARSSPCPPGPATPRRSAARTSRTTAGSRSSTAVVVLARARALPAMNALRTDHPRGCREPRDGDGSRHRRAHARSRSSSRSAASPQARRRAVGRVLRLGRPAAGDALVIFAFIVVVIGGLGSLARHGDGGGGRRSRAAVRELLRVVRPR